MKVPDWIKRLEDTISQWLDTVAVLEQPGRFYPCAGGRTKVGEEAALGFSCFALRIYYIMGLWERLNVERQTKWINFIQSFQRQTPPYEGAFIDPPILNHCSPWLKRAKDIFLKRGHPGLSHMDATCIAETKQAIVTLANVSIKPAIPYKGIPRTPETLEHYLKEGLNWSRPWAAGGQTASLAAFIALEALRFLPASDVAGLKKTATLFFEKMVDPETGAWYMGRRPSHGELVNGAMKVLNALEWLEAPIPYPERLIDTCLSAPPRSEGCHLVDAVYVLYRCSSVTDHRRKDVQEYCRMVLQLIRRHYMPDGAFSFFVGHNQTHYYGARIAFPRRQSDIHGTTLLTWAIAMIKEILELSIPDWNVIRV